MKSEEIKQIAVKWFDAFNAHDLEKLLSLYDESARHFSPKLKIRKPETKGFVEGKNALRDWWRDAFERLPTLQYVPTSFTADDERVFMEYIRKVSGEEDMLIAEVLEVSDGLISFSRVYHA